MPKKKPVINEYNEICLGDRSRTVFLSNILTALNFEPSGPSRLQGLSGLEHNFDAVGSKGKNVVLVVGGAEYLSYMDRKSGSDRLSPRERMEKWRNKALLSAYDVQAALSQDNMIVDLMFFQNVNNKHKWLRTGIKPEEWKKQHNLPPDLGFSSSMSVLEIPLMAREELVQRIS